tara:strand:+ start:3754 stop:10554 length:6801 start_codon:yes stop_codon:yes gene_type:complete
MLFVTQANGEILKEVWNEETSRYDKFTPTEQELNRLQNKPKHTTMPTDEVEDASVLTDIGRVGFSTLEAIPNVASDFVVRPIATNIFDVDEQAYDDGYNKLVSGAAEYVPGLEREDLIDEETGKILPPETGAGQILNIGTYIVGGGIVFKTLNKLSKTQKAKALGRKLGTKESSRLGMVGKAVLAEQTVEQLLSDPDSNLANFVAEDLMDDPPEIIQYLAADKEDSVLLNRAKMAVTSSFLTAGIAGLVKLGFKSSEFAKYAKKVLGKSNPQTPEEAEQVVEYMLKQGRQAEIKDPSQTIRQVREVQEDNAKGIAQMINQSKGGISGGMTWLKQRFFTSRGFYSEEAYEAGQSSIHTQRQLISKASNISRRLSRFMDDTIQQGNKNIVNEVTEALSDKGYKDFKPNEAIDYLTSKYKFSKDIASEVSAARGEIDRLSKALRNSSIGSETIKEAIEGNMGEYIRRSYRLFEDANWTPDNGLITNAQEAIYNSKINKMIGPKKEYASESEIPQEILNRFKAEAKTDVHQIIGKGDRNSFNDYISKVRKVNKKYLTERKDIMPEIRELMGEITNPSENIILTVQKLSNLVENNKFYNKLNELGGSVATDTKAFDDALEIARREASDISDKNNVGRFITLNNRIGKVIKEGPKKTQIQFRGDKKATSINSNELEDVLIPKDKTVKDLAKKIYDENTGGNAYTQEKYIKENVDGIFTTEIKGTGSVLDGQFTTPALARAINNLEDTHTFWGLFNEGAKNVSAVQWFAGAKGLNQQMRTVYDHTTHLRNNLGGFQFGLANGLNPLDNGKLNFAVLKNQIGGGTNNRIFDAYYEKLQGLGVINTSVRASEARALVDMASETIPSRFASKFNRYAEKLPIMKRPKEIGKFVKERPEQIYMANDDFYKMNAFANELDTLQKAYKGDKSWTVERLEKEAARKVMNTIPNYDRVSKGIKALREAPFGNFVSFPAEIARTSVNIIREGVEESLSGNSELRKRGLQRLAGFGTVNLGWYGIGAGTNKLLGFNDTENNGLQVNAEGFTVNHNKQVLRGKDGTFFIHDPTYLNSYNLWQDVALHFHREISLGKLSGKAANERIWGGVVESIKVATQPFTDEAMFTSMLKDIVEAVDSPKGVTNEGKQIFTNKDDIGESVLDAMAYVGQSFAPGFILDGEKYAEAVFKTPNPTTGLQRSLTARTVEMLSGINYREYKPEDNFKYHVKKYNRAISSFERNKLRPQYGKEPEELFDEFAKGQSKKYAASQELYRQIEAMRDLGHHPQEIYYMMRQVGLSSVGDTYTLMRGQFNPDKLTFPREYQIIKRSEDKDKAIEFNQTVQNYVKRIAGAELQPVEEEDLRTSKMIRDTVSLKDFERIKFEKGGEVYNVPNVGKEPDERIDKMTGMPYNMQAGSAFMDDEDPLKRLGYTGGGQVDPLVRLGFFKGGKILGSLKRSRFMEGGSTYKIQRGDTLSEIAEAQGVSQAKLQELNQIENPDNILAGSELQLPERKEAISEEVVSEEFTEQDTANVAADALREVILSDRDLETEIETEKKRGISFSLIPEAQAATGDVEDSDKEYGPVDALIDISTASLTGKERSDKIKDIEEELKDDDYEGLFGEGKLHLHQVLNEIKKDLSEGQINSLEAGLREMGARIDMLFAPVGELVGTVASALTPDAIEEPIKRELAEVGENIGEWIKENGYEQYAKNINAAISILGIIPTAQVLKRGVNTIAAGTKTKLDKFYNKGFDKDGKAIPFESPLERKISQTTSAGIAFSRAGPEGIADALLPGMIARRRAGAAGTKRKEIIREAETANIEDAYASAIAGRNIVDQSPNTAQGDLLKDSAIEKSYIYKTEELSNDKEIRAALFKDNNDFDIPMVIQDRAMDHITSVWTAGINVTVKGRKISSERPMNPNNTDVDIKRLDGPQQLLGESHGTSDIAANSLRKIFAGNNRIKMAKYINQLNPDGTPKAGVRLTGGKPQKASLGTKRNTDVNVDNTLAGATPEQIKAWLDFDGGGKQGASVSFKVDEQNPNIVYWQDSHTSKSKESGGVNDFIAMDLKTGDVYTIISDKHDMLANLDPLGGSSRLTIAPMTKRNFKDPKKVGTHKQRDYQGEAQATLDMLETYKLELPDGGLTMPTYDPVTGLIPTGTKTVKLLKETKADMDTLRKIANAEKIEKVGNSWKVDGTTVSKGELEAATHINLTTIAHFSGKASAKDYGVLARRLGKGSAAAGFLMGESAEELKREGSVLGGLINISNQKDTIPVIPNGKVLGALSRVAVNA